MRSLAVKFTLAFLLIGLIGAVLVALLTGLRTRQAFDQFVYNQNSSLLVDYLEAFYDEQGSWDGLAETAVRRRFDFRRFGAVVVTDENGRILVSNVPLQDDIDLPLARVPHKTAISHSGETVGWLLLTEPHRMEGRPPQFVINRIDPNAIGREFLSNIAWAATVSAFFAIVISLLMGGLLARTLTRPIRELTAVTQRMAKSELGLQVPVTSKDEIGQLATSFNQMSAELAQNQKQRRQMTADIAHDLRTPLSVLRGYMEGLQDGRLQGNEKIYDIMFGEVLHLQHLVEELRTLSLADAGELSLNLRPVDPKALLERSGLAHILQAEEKGLRLRIEAADDLPSIVVDTDRMTQVLNNLVANSILYTDQGEIVLGAAYVEGKVLLTVQDQGKGIPEEALPHIFQRFYRVDASRQRGDGASSGLGLAIAKAIVEAHGGEITAVSIPNHGTTFMISLEVGS